MSPLALASALGLTSHPHWPELQPIIAILLESFRKMLYQFSMAETIFRKVLLLRFKYI